MWIFQRLSIFILKHFRKNHYWSDFKMLVLKIKYWYTKSSYTEIYSNILFYNFAISRAKVFLPLSFSLQFYHWIKKTRRAGESHSSLWLSEVPSQQSGIIPRRSIVTWLQGEEKISRKWLKIKMECDELEI